MTRTTRALISSRTALILSFAALGLVGCARAEAAPTPADLSPPIAVTTTDVALRDVPKVLTVTGTLLANRNSDVAADVAGRVLQTSAERGDFVAKGAVLARLDARSAALSRTEAAAQVESARVQRETSKLECERAERLFSANAISRSELDRTRASCESSDHSERAARARQSMAEKGLTDATIRAPFAGMVVERDVSIGEYVTPGRRVATLVELDPLRLELTVPERASAAVQVDGPVEFRVKAFPGERFSAKIRYIGPVLRRATRDLVVEAIVENSKHRLRPGTFCEAELRVGDERLPVIPRTALVGQEPSLRAFVVNRGVVEERVVLAGAHAGGGVAILKGLNAGERIVTQPSAEVKDGVHVR